jgi:hypothetical protein
MRFLSPSRVVLLALTFTVACDPASSAPAEGGSVGESDGGARVDASETGAPLDASDAGARVDGAETGALADAADAVDAASGAGACGSQPSGGACNALTSPPGVAYTCSSDPLPTTAMTGGPLRDGVYFATESTDYGVPTCSPGTYHQVMQVCGDTIQSYKVDTGSPDRWSVRFSTQQNQITMVPTCGGGNTDTYPYTATPTAFVLRTPTAVVTFTRQP